MPPLTLYQAPGTCAQVVHIALEELDLVYETHALALMAGEHRAPDYLAINASGKVPTLLVDGVALPETLAILRWLDETRPGRLMPRRGADALARARDWALLAWFASTAHPVFTRFRVPPAVIDDPQQFGKVVGHAAPVLAGYFAQAAERLGQGDWLLGDQFSAADIYLAWLWREALAGGFDPKAFPSLEAHRARVDARPAVARVLARDAEMLAGFAARGLAPPVGAGRP